MRDKIVVMKKECRIDGGYEWISTNNEYTLQVGFEKRRRLNAFMVRE